MLVIECKCFCFTVDKYVTAPKQKSCYQPKENCDLLKVCMAQSLLAINK